MLKFHETFGTYNIAKRLLIQIVAEHIEEKLLKEWSPDQISGRLKDKDIATISHEAIYQHIWKNKRAGGVLYKQLRHNGKKYNKRSSGKAGRSCIPGMVQKVLFLANTLHFKKMTTVISIKRLWVFLKNKVFTTFEPCHVFIQNNLNPILLPL